MGRAGVVWVAVAVLIGPGFAREAEAVDVWNARTLTRLFYDDFEDATASPSSTIDGSGDYDPVAVVG